MTGKRTLKSMTAYGRATLACSLGQFVVELHSVNRRYLEIHPHLPSEFFCFEAEIRKWIAASVFRGQLTVRLSVLFGDEVPFSLQPNLTLARHMKAAWIAIANALHVPEEKGFHLDLLKDVKGLIHTENNLQMQENLLFSLKAVFTEALTHLNEMKETEGEYLQRDILERIQNICEGVKEIASLAPAASKRFEDKLREKMREFFIGSSSEHEERLMREVCVYTEKVDVAEEIVRLQSHLEQFTALVKHPKESVGKTLEFFVQEMNREVNTIGSKASELKVSQLIIEIKSELERIREQIQNVE